MTSKDIVPGAKFGKWTVLEIDVINPASKAKKPPKMALCQCECGTKRYKEYRDLYAGRSLSCGCWRADYMREQNHNKTSVKIGNIYGYLEVIEDLGYRLQKRGRQERWYKCLCHNCGNNQFETTGNNLTSGSTRSCGCVNSYGEKIIKQILLKNHINFSCQYTFSDLRSNKGGLLKFDFAVFNDNNELDFLIEFDGRQHFTGPDGKWTNSYSLEELQQRDKLKNDYCKKHHYKLKRISYFDINKITLSALQDDTFTI